MSLGASPEASRHSRLAGSASRILRQLRFEAGTLLRKYPSVYLPIAGWWHRGERVTSETQFVMEGFPRSGNTFCSAAFGSSQSRPVVVARHVHAPAQVIAATRAKVPTLVLIRQPEDAILSLVIQHPHITIRQAMRAYLRFYIPLLPIRHRFVVATFGDVTTDFGAVIARVNDRFGTNFDVFEHSEEAERRCIEMMIRDNRHVYRDGRELALKGAFPSPLRAREKDRLRARYADPRLEGLRQKVNRVYEDFTSQRR